MTILCNLQEAISPSLVRTSRGWIGIDIGSGSIKLAQVERRLEKFVISNRWLVTQADEPLTYDALTQGVLASKQLRLSACRKLFSRSTCAATMSMSFQAMRSMELPAACREEMRDMIREELEQESTDQEQNCVFDYWITKEGIDDASKVTTLSMPTTLATQVTKDLLRSGYECQVLDGLPCAMARAMTMCGGDCDSPVVALDLGDSEFTFVLVEHGKPLLTRVLRGGGLRTMLKPLRDSLDISHEQAMLLLRRYEIATVNDSDRRLKSGPTQLLEQPLAQLIHELRRTIGYLAGQFSASKPSALVLLGGGALIRNLPIYLGEQLGLDTRIWSLPSTDPEEAEDDAIFGVAAALSVLRWEDTTCL